MDAVLADNGVYTQSPNFNSREIAGSGKRRPADIVAFYQGTITIVNANGRVIRIPYLVARYLVIDCIQATGIPQYLNTGTPPVNNIVLNFGKVGIISFGKAIGSGRDPIKN